MSIRANISSWFYRRSRAKTIKKVYATQERLSQPKDLESVIEIGDHLLRELAEWTYRFEIPTGIEAHLHELKFQSPITLAAFKDDFDVIEIWLALGLGGACVKTSMWEERSGNDRPRIQEVVVNGHDCLINAMGLPGLAIEQKIRKLDESSLSSSKKPIGLSVGGSSLEEYKQVFLKLEEFLVKKVPLYYYEVNPSCPNTPEGQLMTKNPELLDELISFMRERTDAIIGAKLSPDCSNDELLSTVELLLKYDRTYANLGNTSSRTCEQVGLPSKAISIGKGGLSGPELFQRTLEMTKLIAPVIPVIATGGAGSVDNVKELLDNGAALVGIATAIVQDMYCVPKWNHALAKRK